LYLVPIDPGVVHGGRPGDNANQGAVGVLSGFCGRSRQWHRGSSWRCPSLWRRLRGYLLDDGDVGGGPAGSGDEISAGGFRRPRAPPGTIDWPRSRRFMLRCANVPGGPPAR
jgi:hypothetical protein